MTANHSSDIFASYMKTRDVAIGFIVLIALIAGVLVIKNSQKGKTATLPSPTPNFGVVENKFPSLKVPANADRASLNDISGDGGMGEAFRTFQNGQFSLTVMANLPDPKSGTYYQAWMVRGNPGDVNFSYASLGRLGIAKGGYLVDFISSKDYSDYKAIVVSVQTTTSVTPQTHLLEGSF